ncbi:bifunctional serine/threonine-protein kinase/universal stress protein [Rhizobiaceae bacterium BDR2-2]|uniref:Bifunctional serine/threonine-protein kinase/universal stress protein n=1 Tax=Ectorhizobium quercum TaxID=2965071 RepID=A0AAE3SW89_9HYPH|nr:bifunctional serine/threonine-protein kinase/universal stress protein [Ectorhizobium quercum]MCX8998932.1 bifunctional serine/threonine-protein kinase/universal stress protein [Ectorhizobium quercum]
MARAKLGAGDVIDGFTLGTMAHKGGMARLWHVTHPDHDFPMLMKVPELGEGADPAAVVGFEMEQMILPRLSGPHVPRFVANGDFDFQPYIVFEVVPGKSLLPLLASLPLAPDQVADLGGRIATALDSLHHQKVVHLDVKPSNVMFRPGGEAVLIDYGLARHLELPDLMHEEFRLPYGTAPYMAPEQILGHRSDFRSDIFALGALMYFFVTGRRPFGDPQGLKGLKRRLWRDPWPPRALDPSIPPALQEVILRCLEINPARRYPTAAQLAVDLQDLPAVALSPRAEKTRRDPFAIVLKRRFNPDPVDMVRPEQAVGQLFDAPIVLVAIDLLGATPTLLETLRTVVATTLAAMPDARVACLNVMKVSRIVLDSSLDEDGRSKHVKRLAELRNWAAALDAPQGGVTFHVIEAVSPAQAILEYARENHVDHIVMGARAEAAMRSLLGSVAGEVAAHAPCTVTVVRNRVWPGAARPADA